MTKSAFWGQNSGGGHGGDKPIFQIVGGDPPPLAETLAFHHLVKLQMIYNYVFKETCEKLVVEKLRKVFKRARLHPQKISVGRLWKQLLLHVMENHCLKNFENG